MKGIVGRFFFQFGITVTFAVLISLFVSFTLDPMLSSRWYDPDIERKGKRHLVARILDRFNAWFDQTADRYRVVIAWALKHRKITLLIALICLFGGLAVFFSLQSEFFPGYDQGEFEVNFTTAPDASVDETRGRVRAVLTSLKGIPEIQHTYATIGAGDQGTVRDAKVYVKLVDRKARKRLQRAIQEEARGRLQKIPGILPFITEAGRMDTQKPLLVNVRGDDISLLKKYAAALKERMYQIPGIVDIEVTLEQDIPEYRLAVDRERAVDVGITTAHIVRTVGTLVGGQTVTTYEDEDGDAVNVRVRLPNALRQDPSHVEKLRLAVQKSGNSPALIPLGELVSFSIKPTPSEIDRQDLTRQVLISANLDRLPLGTALEKVGQAASQIHLAPGYQVVFSGEAEQMAESLG
jgi:HAE1 family hydrophobic/amphiphilic exporter-1